jgi:hypothetical protein
LLDGDLAGTFGEICPPVSQVSHATHLTGVVAAHVAPDLPRSVVTQPPIELHVQAKLFDDDVQVLGSVAQPAQLPSTLRQTMHSAKSGITDLERRLGTSRQIWQGIVDDATPACPGPLRECRAQSVRGGRAIADGIGHQAKGGVGGASTRQQIQHRALDAGTPRRQRGVAVSWRDGA